MPYGKYALDPFPEKADPSLVFVDIHLNAERVWEFSTRYELNGEMRSAQIFLVATKDDPIAWSASITVNNITINAGELDTINWYPTEESLMNMTLRRIQQLTLPCDDINTLLDDIAPVVGMSRDQLANKIAKQRSITELCTDLSKRARERGNILQWYRTPRKLHTVK